jgi:KDO2-lipid IV(A) lauroyltransferase
MLSDRFWKTKFAPLRYAVAWLGYVCMRTVVLLPFDWQIRLGKSLGSAAYRIAPGRRRIAERNIAACFPLLTAAQRDTLIHEHFRALGASLVEMSMGWFGPEQTVRDLIRIEGEEHLRTALARGRGVVLLSAHFTTFEFFWPALAPLCPRLCGMYKGQRNPVMNKIMTRGRLRNFTELFPNDNVRHMIRNLRSNSVVWYASDQSYSGKSSALLPFFGEPAMTNIAIGRIAKTSGAAVLPYFCRRLADDSGYVMTIGAPLDDWPTGDDVSDTARHVRLLEEYIRLCPEQYWWVHKRFKGRPASLPDLYSRARHAA